MPTDDTLDWPPLVCRVGEFEAKICTKNCNFKVFLTFLNFWIFFQKLFQNAFDINYTHISDGRFATKIGAFMWMVGAFGAILPVIISACQPPTTNFWVPNQSVT